MFRNPLEEQGGEGLFAPHYAFPKKNALSVHYVPTTSARTPVAHCVQGRVTCPSWGAPPQGPQTKGGKIRISSLNLAFSGAQKWAGMLHHPCILGGPLQRGQNQSGPKSRRKCYITPAFSGSCMLYPLGMEPMTLQLQRYYLTHWGMGHL